MKRLHLSACMKVFWLISAVQSLTKRMKVWKKQKTPQTTTSAAAVEKKDYDEVAVDDTPIAALLPQFNFFLFA